MMSRSSTPRRRAQSGATNHSHPRSSTCATRRDRPEPPSHDTSCGSQLAASACAIDERTTSSGKAATSPSSSANRVSIPPAGGGVTTSGSHFVDATSEITPDANESPRTHPSKAGRCRAYQSASHGSGRPRRNAISEPNVSASGETANRQRDNAAGTLGAEQSGVRRKALLLVRLARSARPYWF